MIDSSFQLKDSTIFEQGAGKFDLQEAFKQLTGFQPKISLFPQILNLTSDQYYLHPYSSQPFYETQLSTIFNITVLNSFENEIKMIKYVWDSASTMKDSLIVI